MTQLFTIGDPRTLYCKARMSAHRGVWNGVTSSWMFADANNHANAVCELYKATHASISMRVTLGEMILGGTAVSAWGIDPLTEMIDIDNLDFARAQELLTAGNAARRVLGIHPLEDRVSDRTSEDDDELRDVAFDERARASASRGRCGGRSAV